MATTRRERAWISLAIICVLGMAAGVIFNIRSCNGDRVAVAERYTVECIDRASASTSAVFVIECRHKGRSLSAAQIERISNALYAAGFELTRNSDSRAGAELVFFTRAAAQPKE